MTIYNKFIFCFILIVLALSTKPQLEAITYVTDTGGCAFDEARAVANLAPAIALGTVAVAGIIAIAVQNSHGRSSSSSSHYSSSSHSSFSSHY